MLFCTLCIQAALKQSHSLAFCTVFVILGTVFVILWAADWLSGNSVARFSTPY